MAASPPWLKVFACGAFGHLLLTMAFAELLILPLDLNNDATYYAHMALEWKPVIPPFTFRILVPQLVRALSFLTLPVAAALVTSVMMGFAYACLHNLMRRVTDRPIVIALGFGVVATSSIVRSLMTSPFYVDAGLLLSCCLVYVLVLDRRWWALVIVAPIAVTAHEMVLLALIPALVVARRARALRFAITATVLALVVYLVLHRSSLLYGEVVTNRPYFDPEYWKGNLDYVGAELGSVTAGLWLAFVGSAGIAWLGVPYGWSRAPREIRAGLLIVPATLPLMLIATDWNRLLIPVVPIVVVMFAAALDGIGAADSAPATAGSSS